MAHSKRDEFAAELNQGPNVLRPRFVAALEAMDYAPALDCQIEIDDLRRQRASLHYDPQTGLITPRGRNGVYQMRLIETLSSSCAVTRGNIFATDR